MPANLTPLAQVGDHPLRVNPGADVRDTSVMSGCCDPRGCNDMFGPRFSRHLRSRYRKRGLDKTATRIVDFVASHGVDRATVLEVGGGIGDIQLELLRRGAEHATNLELVDVYDTDATQIAAAAGLSDRVTRRLVDIAATPEAVEPADIVILHRVVCCYPDYERLLAAAADHARHLLVFSHPPRNVVSRAFMTAQNATFRLLGKSFRTFTHPPAAMVAVAESRGMNAEYTHRGRVWQVVGLARTTPAA
jgi:2-polyprenyl-3-methyl-5-hydroxy-6-metoxy-1,4-benzoquinol methylase